MPITALPAAPEPIDSRATFVSKAFAWVSALVGFTTQANALEVAVNAKEASAQVASNSAAASAAAAQALVNAVAFNAATNYAQYAAAISTVNLLTYRRKTAGTSATDPANDSVNWVNTGLPPVVVVRTAVSVNPILPGVVYIVTAGGITLTLPASPGGQDVFFYRTAPSVTATWSLAAAGGNKIEGQVATWTADVPNMRGGLWFDATDGYTHIR